MEFSIFNNTKHIIINDMLINEYKESVVPFTAKRAEYLAVTSGMDKNSSEEDIRKGIIEGIYEEINLYKNKHSIITQAKEMSLIPSTTHGLKPTGLLET